MIGPMGWTWNPAAVGQILATSPTPVYRVAAWTGRDAGRGKFSPLYRTIAKAAGKPIQPNDQTIGDCVGHGFAKAGAIAVAVAALDRSSPATWQGEPSPEWIYGASRVEIGRGRLGAGDGSTGSWAAEALRIHGIAFQRRYEQHDLTQYDGNRSRQWGAPRHGTPDSLEPLAKRHRILTTSLVTTYEEARDAIATGYPVAVCSNQGFEERRDANGFATARGTWPHCMCFIAADETRREPGLLCLNSWGRDWITGPTWPDDQPPGSFWVRAADAHRMLSRMPDSWALSAYEGFAPVDYSKWVAA
jgi:hypothetical protein